MRSCAGSPRTRARRRRPAPAPPPTPPGQCLLGAVGLARRTPRPTPWPAAPQVSIVTEHSSRNRVSAESPVRKTFSAMSAQRNSYHAEQRAKTESGRNADPDDGTVLFGFSAGMKQRDISVRRARRPQVEQRGILCDRARHRPNTEVAQPELTHNVRSRKQIHPVADGQRQDLCSRPDLERLHSLASFEPFGAVEGEARRGGYPSAPHSSRSRCPVATYRTWPRSS